MLPALLVPCLPVTARAELPFWSDFVVTYHVTDEDGALGRPLTADERGSYVNVARAQCGHQLGVHVRFTGEASGVGQLYEAFVGTECLVAESHPSGAFPRCGRLFHELETQLFHGVSATFHPSYLAFGHTPGSPSRDIGDPATVLHSITSRVVGEAGVWMCAPNDNGHPECQLGDFFYNAYPDSSVPTVGYDFIPPPRAAHDLTVEPGSGSAEVRWELPEDTGNIAGFRVLCEAASSGAGTGFAFRAPALDAVHDGTHYFTAGNLCGGEPFSTVLTAPSQVSDPNTCGNGVVEAGEACDDGDDNGPDDLCDDDCRLRVGAGLHALDWSHVCTGHIPATARSAVIDGLVNGETYNLVLVAYDRAGNPRVQGLRSTTPDASLPDLADAGDGCACATDEPGRWGPLSICLVSLLALARRRVRHGAPRSAIATSMRPAATHDDDL